MGNSDRRAAAAVKKFAQTHPHRLKDWYPDALTNVAYMDKGDFYGNEQSVILQQEQEIEIVLTGEDGRETVLKKITGEKGEILDATYMDVEQLRNFYRKTIDDALEEGTLYSLHLKATMMKVSDPIMFGHAVYIFYREVFDTYKKEFDETGANPNLGLADIFKKLDRLPEAKKDEILQAFDRIAAKRPGIAMVNSDKGITNFHKPNDIIIDASMPVVIRDGGKMWNKNGKLQECKTVIPDRTYARMYEAIVNDCRTHGKFDVATMGNVANVGLMAQKAEEYGSHPTTFEIPHSGTVIVRTTGGEKLMKHHVKKGDIWRMSRTKDLPVKDWVRLAVERARLTGNPAVFWLDENRPHDANLLLKVHSYLKEHDTRNLEIRFDDPVSAMKYTLERVRQGKNTISVTGNVLRDYLTDLFPILELGTSARMLSIVPLMAGGGLFETGAGGSAPKHVQQFLQEGHLRWDSLGEFLALAESLRHIAVKSNDKKAEILAETLDEANETYLMNAKSPSRIAGEPGTEASHYYLAMYWAKALGKQTKSAELQKTFISVYEKLAQNETAILNEMIAKEGKPADTGGYYRPDPALASKAMRPSRIFNKIIDELGSAEKLSNT